MKGENTEKRRFSLQKVDKIILIVLAAIALILIVLSIMSRCGISLIAGELYLYGPFAMMFILLGWGAYAIFRLLKKKILRIVVGTLLAMVIFMVGTVGFTYLSFVSNVSIPQKFSEVVSPSGAHKLVVLRGLDPDEARIEHRKEARLAADPDGNPEIEVNDWGYKFYVYPKTLGFFYRADAQVEGEVYIGYASEGKLMVEWLNDEKTAHFFVEDPDIADGGDWYINF